MSPYMVDNVPATGLPYVVKVSSFELETNPEFKDSVNGEAMSTLSEVLELLRSRALEGLNNGNCIRAGQ